MQSVQAGRHRSCATRIHAPLGATHGTDRLGDVTVVVTDCAMADEDVRVLKSIEQFLFREARTLDHRDYEAWFAMLADDIRYVVRAQEMRDAGAKAVSYALIDEGRSELGQRIDQIRNPRLSRAENPPSPLSAHDFKHRNPGRGLRRHLESEFVCHGPPRARECPARRILRGRTIRRHPNDFRRSALGAPRGRS